MSEATFTIHDYIEHLVAGGVPKAQAEAIASANARLRRAEQEGDDGLVTKKDMRIGFAELRGDLKVDALKWGIGLLLAYSGINVTLFVTLSKFFVSTTG